MVLVSRGADRAMTRREFIAELGKLLHRADKRISLSLMDKGNAVCVVQERLHMCIADYIDISGNGNLMIANKILEVIIAE